MWRKEPNAEKFIKTSEKSNQIKQLALKPIWSDKFLQNWIKAIYSGQEKRSKEYKKFLQQYSEVIHTNNAFVQNITDLAVDTILFSDVKFLFSDNVEIPFHRAFLLANINETLLLTRLTEETILKASPQTVFKIPFNFPDFSALKLFLYTYQVDITKDNVWKTLEFSLKMHAGENLSKICEKFSL